MPRGVYPRKKAVVPQGKSETRLTIDVERAQRDLAEAKREIEGVQEAIEKGDRAAEELKQAKRELQGMLE